MHTESGDFALSAKRPSLWERSLDSWLKSVTLDSTFRLTHNWNQKIICLTGIL
jgi:hypothetical protein